MNIISAAIEALANQISIMKTKIQVPAIDPTIEIITIANVEVTKVQISQWQILINTLNVERRRMSKQRKFLQFHTTYRKPKMKIHCKALKLM